MGPLSVRIRAPRASVYEILSRPYLGRATHAQREKLEVLERGADLVLAAHRTRSAAAWWR